MQNLLVEIHLYVEFRKVLRRERSSHQQRDHDLHESHRKETAVSPLP